VPLSLFSSPLDKGVLRETLRDAPRCFGRRSSVRREGEVDRSKTPPPRKRAKSKKERRKRREKLKGLAVRHVPQSNVGEMATEERDPLALPPAKHGILKHPVAAQEKPKKEFRWDEEAVAATEAGKDSTMKIDEPPTPYNHDSFSEGDTDSEEEEEGDPAVGGDAEMAQSNAKGGSPPSVPAGGPPIAAANPDAFSQALSGALSGVAAEEQTDEYQPKDLEEAIHSQFTEKRKQHYNEFEAMRRWRESHTDDEDEDESDA
jgi:protein phosphatase inhibitor 2